MPDYYAGKIDSLCDLFGSQPVALEHNRLMVSGHGYPIVDDVIVLLDPAEYPPAIKRRLAIASPGPTARDHGIAEDIQFTFGKEWLSFPKILPDHEREFRRYFDLVDLSTLRELRVCDLGCGIGRWSYFLAGRCRELVLVDFSEAIFVARRNLSAVGNALFFMGDLQKLPFRPAFADFMVCLGVLHHLPTPALEEVRALRKYARRLLVYLYYALDNRPLHFRLLLALVTASRSRLCTWRNPAFRNAFTWLGALGLYMPFLLAGAALRPAGLSRHVPLYEVYRGKSLERIRQDVYDRFFTRIEQRFSRTQIIQLSDTFSRVAFSADPPYWHFLCED